jgi:thymidylate synthase
MRNGIPTISVVGHCLAWAWEQSLLELYHHGCDVKTQYDKPGDPPSKDCTLMLTVEHPLDEPVIHRCFPDSLYGLRQYANEIMHGLSDDALKDTYTYHRRLFKYQVPVRDLVNGAATTWSIDQIESMCQKIAEDPITRRAQAITWRVDEDIDDSHAPCLQRIWCRMSEDDQTCAWRLNMDVSIRSNDAFKAGFMNMFAFISLQQYMAQRIAVLRGDVVRLGRYCHFADSYHIYGKDLDRFEKEVLGAVAKRTFDQRTWRLSDPDVERRMSTPPNVRTGL